jgi:hypothetical protein
MMFVFGNMVMIIRETQLENLVNQTIIIGLTVERFRICVLFG